VFGSYEHSVRTVWHPFCLFQASGSIDLLIDKQELIGNKVLKASDLGGSDTVDVSVGRQFRGKIFGPRKARQCDSMGWQLERVVSLFFLSVAPRMPTYEEIKVKYKNLYCHREFSLRHFRYSLLANLHPREIPVQASQIEFH
jgi:hypothetical protein